MRKILVILLLAFINVPIISFAQKNKIVDSLCRLCNLAVSDTDKVVTLNNLANYYYSNKFTKQGDSVLGVQLRTAVLSDNKNLILKTYFDNSIANIAFWSRAEDFNKTLDFIQKGIDYAKKVNDYSYIVIGYTRLAGVLRSRGMADRAVTNATTALANVQEGVPDSLKAIANIELGDSYRSKGEAVLASRSYNNAYDIAIKNANYYLETDVYRRLSKLYRYLGERTEAKDYLVKSLNLNKTHGNNEGIIKDYIELAKSEGELFYATEALRLADSLHFDSYKTDIKDIILAYHTVNGGDSKIALDYLHSQPDLHAHYTEGGAQDYYFELGEIYRYGGNADSALYFFKLSEPEMLKKYDIEKTRYLYYEMAACYEIKKDRQNAISYYEKSLGFCQQVHDLSTIAGISNALTNLYKAGNDFKNALSYKELATATQDSLSQLAKNKDMILLSVERDKKQHDEELLRIEQAFVKKRNLQYMFITIAICLVFILMLVIGTFPISKLTINILGYFFFISLFEFIVLILDNNVLHSITHGEPLKLWLIKIALIGMLVPLQHFLEHRLIKFLESRQLLRARTKFSLVKLLPKKKAGPHTKTKTKTKKSVKSMEDDTAVS
ncbi:MAG: tetratricopeptide repeat protein [Chitinophagales bacterium]